MGNTSEEVYLNLRSSEDSFQLVLTDVSPLQKAVKDRQWVRRRWLHLPCLLMAQKGEGCGWWRLWLQQTPRGHSESQDDSRPSQRLGRTLMETGSLLKAEEVEKRCYGEGGCRRVYSEQREVPRVTPDGLQRRRGWEDREKAAAESWPQRPHDEGWKGGWGERRGGLPRRLCLFPESWQLLML